MTVKAKLGAPRKHPSRRRSSILPLRLTPPERTALERHAAAERLNVSELVRQQLAPLFTS